QQQRLRLEAGALVGAQQMPQPADGRARSVAAEIELRDVELVPRQLRERRADHLARLVDVLAVRVVEDEAAQLAQRLARGALVALPRRRREEEVARDLPVV